MGGTTSQRSPYKSTCNDNWKREPSDQYYRRSYPFQNHEKNRGEKSENLRSPLYKKKEGGGKNWIQTTMVFSNWIEYRLITLKQLLTTWNCISFNKFRVFKLVKLGPAISCSMNLLQTLRSLTQSRELILTLLQTLGNAEPPVKRKLIWRKAE